MKDFEHFPMTKKAGRPAEVRYNHNHDPVTGRFVSAASVSKRYSNGGAKPIDKSTEIDYNKINEEIKNNPIISDDIGTAEKPVPVDIKSYRKHALERMEKRQITKENAQSYVDTSIIAFNQDTAEAYYSSSGVSVVRKSDSELITTFSECDFDDGAKEIIKVANKYGL